MSLSQKGVQVMTAVPACLIMLMYLAALSLLVFLYWKLFVVEWSAMVYSRPVDCSVTDTKVTSSRLYSRVICQFLVVLFFISLSLLANALYVTGILFEPRFLILYQVSLLLFSSAYRLYLLPLLMESIFKTKDEGIIATSIVVYATILSIADIVNPWLATLLTDDLCFRGLLIGQNDITATYTYTDCTFTLFTGSTRECLEYTAFPIRISFAPPFIYSNQCRIAMFLNFVPVIIYTSAYNAFVAPVLHVVSTWNVNNLTDHYSIFGIQLPARSMILPNVTYELVFIVNEIALILIYGIVSPFCAIALGMSSVVRMVLLRSSIYRYCQLQFMNLSDVGSVDRDKNHIDEICRDARRYLHLFIWPSLILSSFLIALFLLDMTYDDEGSPSLAGPFSIFVITILGAQVIRVVFLRSKAGLDRALQQNLQSMEDDKNSRNAFDSAEAREGAGNVASSSSSKPVFTNPLQVSIELQPSSP